MTPVPDSLSNLIVPVVNVEAFNSPFYSSYNQVDISAGDVDLLDVPQGEIWHVVAVSRESLATTARDLEGAILVQMTNDFMVPGLPAWSGGIVLAMGAAAVHREFASGQVVLPAGSHIKIQGSTDASDNAVGVSLSILRFYA